MPSFWESCGARGPLTLEVEGGGASAPARHIFDRPFLLIGSGPRSDLLLDHRDVSRRHAYLQVIGGRPFCVDLDSRTGTRVAGGTPSGGWVDPDRPIRIGPYRVRITVTGAEEAGPPAVIRDPLSGRVVAPGPRPVATLEVEQPGEPRSIPINRTLSLIGGSGRCKIRLATSRSSRFLGALIRTPGGFWAVDLRSSGGFSVNGACLSYSRLEPGDELRLGPLVARMGGPATPARRDMLPSAIAGAGPMVGPLDPSDDLRAFLVQVAEVQEQSSDQFRQAISMVTQLFGSMHRETIDLVREELEQVRALVGELKALRGGAVAGQTGATGKARGQIASLPEPGQQAEGEPPPDDPGSAGPGQPLDPGEIHLIVSERLAAFDRDRRGRWNRLSGILGKNHP